ncbi:MAG: flagellar type III secretion system protein FlhB [Paracoccaceae bacterium]
MTAQDEDTEKSHEATQQKLDEARKKGEVARSADLSTAASYFGFLLAALIVGGASLQSLGSTLTTLLDQANELAPMFFSAGGYAVMGDVLQKTGLAFLPWFALPALAVLLSILVQRGFTVTASKLELKLSRISVVSNAKNKFGRNGLFEFFKSFVKLIIYSVVLALFIRAKLDEIVMVVNTTPLIVAAVLGRLCIEFLFVVLAVSLSIGGIDALWQHHEHLRKNRMSRKEVMDETKASEGDPHMKQQRRQRGYDIATSQMMADVPTADVVIVNPTHYAVALKWSRKQGEVPVCVAKGVDEVARSIREVAMEAGVPIQADPSTARALFATTDIGQEIDESQYRGVAAAIRFAEEMRKRARARMDE